MTKAILHTIDTTGPGGAETIFLDLALHLQIDGYKNIAVIKGPGWVEDQLKKRNIEYYIIKPHGFLSLPYYWQFFKFIKKQNVQFVQAHLLGSILTCSIVCKLCGIPLVATLHGQVDINLREKFVFLKQWLMGYGVSCLVAVSRNLAEYIKQRGLFKTKKIEIIYNGVDTSRYYRSVNGEMRAKFKLSENAVLVGSLGNVRPAKNYELLVESAAIVIKNNGLTNVHFFIAGHQKTDLMQKLNELVAKRDITNNIHFLGFTDDTPKYLSELDIFLLTSSSEGFSIATIEAMAAGIPVMSTKCGGPEEIITNSENGILLPLNDPKAIADAISQLIQNKELAADLTRSAKSRVLNTFSMKVMIEKYRQLYHNCIDKQ